MEKIVIASPLLQAPEPLGPGHDVSRFSNGVHASLDLWLYEQARSNEVSKARTYVVCPVDEPKDIVGYFSISAALEKRLPHSSSVKIKRESHEQIPLLLIGRLAVDKSKHGLGIGTALLTDALKRCFAISEIAGTRGVIVHAIDDAAAAFYSGRGFVPSPMGERIMLMSTKTIRTMLRAD